MSTTLEKPEIKKQTLKVRSNEEIADEIFQMDLEGDFEGYLPGQFLHIKCGDGIEPLLRRPISICDVDSERKVLSIVYRAEGKGTQLLSKIQGSENLGVDSLGPLGVSFPSDQLKSSQTVLLVGGGIGIPPLYFLGKELAQRGINLQVILGFNSKKDVFLEEEFKKLSELGISSEVQVSTMDGSYGHKGLVTDLFQVSDLQEGTSTKAQAGAFSNWDVLYTCGPTAMMRAIQDKVGTQKEAYMSLEQRMGCGVGACLACVAYPKDKSETISPWGKSYKKICCEGPVFKLQEIDLSSGY